MSSPPFFVTFLTVLYPPFNFCSLLFHFFQFKKIKIKSLVFAPHPPVVPNEDDIVVKEVRAYVMDKSVEEEAGGGADCHAQKHGHWITSTPIANPMSGYAAYKMSRKSWGIDAIGSLIVGKI